MKLKTMRFINGQIRVITGLHIGASNATIEIGGLDNPIIKEPINQAPYIPGSSLKGKLRSLIETKEGKYVKDGKKIGHPCDCGKKECSICAMFGVSDIKKRSEDLGPTRIVVRDAHLSATWKDLFEKGDMPLEIKYENMINRITGEANPRPIERVPASVEFDFEIAVKVFQGDESENYFDTLIEAMCLLEKDALGGSGSRGCGQIKFINVKIDGINQPDFPFSTQLRENSHAVSL